MSLPGEAPRPGCPHCWPADAEAAWAARKGLSAGAELVDESHFGIRLLHCGACAQGFASVFVEDVDWVDGDDSQFWTVVPLSAAELEELDRLDEAALRARLGTLGAGRACLHRDHPKGTTANTDWRHGVTMA